MVRVPKHNLRWYLKTWHNGRHSNIPMCCTLWFWARIWLGIPQFVTSFPAFYRVYSSWMSEKPEEHCYVRCIVCIVRGRFNEMHMCDDACHPRYQTG